MTSTASNVKNRIKPLLQHAWRRADPVLDLFDPNRKRCFPRDFDLIEGYQDRFPDTARAFHVFLKRNRTIRRGTDEPPVAVVVTPWFGTPCPWYAIAIGLGLARRNRSVAFVWHDMAFPEASGYFDRQNEEIGRVMRTLSQRFPVHRISAQPAEPATTLGDDELLDRLAAANLTWSRRGAAPSERDAHLSGRMRDALGEALPRVRSLMRRNEFRYVVACGGLVQSSGLYLKVGSEAGVRAATFDGGFGWIAVSTDGVAAQQTDIARAFALLSSEREERDVAVAAAQDEFEKRRSGLDKTRYQVTSVRGPAEAAADNILLPLSVVFDTAALGRHHIFSDSSDWLTETIKALLRETSDSILVRQHPSERRVTERSRFDVRALLDQSFGSNPQVRFVAAEEPLSTYELLGASRLVLPFVSTIGIEAAALGKPVIVSGDVYYSELGFVWAPTSKEEYFQLLRRGAHGELPPLPDQTERAWLAYYLNAVCNRVWTDFTPQPPDFWRWVTRNPDALYDDLDVVDLITSIDQDVPLPVLRHQRRQQRVPGGSSFPRDSQLETESVGLIWR